MVVMQAQDDDDAIRIVNSCDYGLGGSVFSKDYQRAERITSQIKTGIHLFFFLFPSFFLLLLFLLFFLFLCPSPSLPPLSSNLSPSLAHQAWPTSTILR